MNTVARLTLTALLSTSILGGAIAPAMAANPGPDVKLAKDQTFTYRLGDNVSSIDPQIGEDTYGSAVDRDLFEGLMNQDAKGDLVPGVATGYDVSDDKKVYTFHLRDNAKWSNGDPVTAGDFVYAWERAVDPKTASPYQWFMQLMSIQNADEIIAGKMPADQLGVKAVDDHTFQVTLTQPLPYFPQMTTTATTFPTPQKVIEKWGKEWTKPEHIVSNGAYVLTEYKPGERIVRERNKEYWDDKDTIIDKVVALIINDENVAMTRFEAGELDQTDMPSGQYPRLKKEYPEEAISYPRLCNYYYTFNLSPSGPKAFKDVRVREALSLAVDRKVIADNVLGGGQTPAYTFTPPFVAGFTPPDVPMQDLTQPERDKKAKELMKEAGYGPDHPLSFTMTYNTDKAHQKIAVVMSQMWKQKLGVEAKLGNMEWKTFLQKRKDQDFEMARGAWCGDYNEASTFLDLLTTKSGYNDGKYSNADYDQQIVDAKTSDDPAKNYTKAEEIIAKDAPIIPIYDYAGAYMMSKDLKGWPVDNVEQKWYSRELYKVAE